MHVYCACPELAKDDDLRPLCCDLVLLIIFVFALSLSLSLYSILLTREILASHCNTSRCPGST